mmetsp:Transcript_45050/g.50495  ORF Transcript_45050/g.50495 Transcript_45050/m.50495 type:complete len:168 (-) Transcript_45050:12-515(-)|eukprot:CAMPEP_0170800694 /NCGR_PEP_ID=MMETSP0733-20121128/28007_1 /TAXON_ID=186038 /ORGANISM="Fragilariopsis kerguelensis, Strain L26-C5" /LENGTH=167 /DNA_ID=CAMNT_0011153093 /DNA_START=189 /DNA_END=692 /DNA_ORIENTATION=-
MIGTSSLLYHAALACLIFTSFTEGFIILSLSSGAVSNKSRDCCDWIRSNFDFRLCSDFSGGDGGWSDSSGGQSSQSGGLEQIQFKIYPDGRVEEKVVGVKGKACLEITRELNEKLGNVISTQPTEEMYEEEIKIEQTQTLTNTDGSGSSDGTDSSSSSNSWEGSSSW